MNKITSLNVSKALTGVPTGILSLNGASLGDGSSIKAAFAKTGDCLSPSLRYGEAFVDVGAQTLASVSFAYNAQYFVCWSLDGGQSWSEQSLPRMNVSISMSDFSFFSFAFL